jgi:hypothetical protein
MAQYYVGFAIGVLTGYLVRVYICPGFHRVFKWDR